jgi:hypothetical protein
MKLQKLVLPVILAFALATGSTPQAQATLTAEQIIDKHIAASGGREALSKLTTRRATGTVTLSQGGAELGGPVEILNKAPNKVRVSLQIDLTSVGMADKMSIEQRFDGTTGVMNNSMQGATPITGNQLENMKNAIFPSPLLDYKTHTNKIEVLPQESIDGKPRLVLQITPKTGSVVKLYFDPETFLVVRTKATVNTPEMGDMENVADSSDYRTVDGIKIPFQLVNWNAAQSIKITLTKIENNVPLDDALFAVK